MVLAAAVILLLVDFASAELVWAELALPHRVLVVVVATFSFVYFHYSVQSFLVPLRSLPALAVPRAREVIARSYRSSFFFGTVLLGYLALAYSAVSILLPSARVSYLAIGVAVVTLGVAAQARALIIHLAGQIE